MSAENGCEYYPCHFPGHDCTFCFCPFYPCLDGLTDGRYVVSKKTGRDVWSCKRCGWIHETGVVTGISPELEKIPKDDMKALRELRLKFL
ncbi:MAG: cysteine-rich small domain-containing protein [Candidatus Hydrothermarchaeaceae archaeon]